MEEAPENNPEGAAQDSAPESAEPQAAASKPDAPTDAPPEEGPLEDSDLAADPSEEKTPVVPEISLSDTTEPEETEPAILTEEPDEGSDRIRLRPRQATDLASRRTSKFRRSNSGVQSLQETLKEKQVCNQEL